jgi:cation:H+ antiporter
MLPDLPSGVMEIAIYLIGGLIVMILGGEFLVRGSVRFAERMGMSPLLIGLTLVGFGTSTPELVASVTAALEGSPGIAYGNIVGSNIINILLILGVSAIIFPIAVQSNALKRDGVLVLATAILLSVVAWVWTMDRATGVFFIALLICYLVYAYLQERSPATIAADGHTAAYDKAEAFEEVLHHQNQTHVRSPALDIAISLGMALAGLALVILGGNFFVAGAIDLARALGMTEEVIGLTIVAVGTSMPELVTSFIAAIRKNSDVALGNILGSNIYNILGIGGVTALIAPSDVPAGITMIDNPVMIATSVLLLVVAYTGLRIGRREGALMAACYVAYVIYQLMR